VSIGVVGKGSLYHESNEEETSRYLTMIQGEERRGAPAVAVDLPVEERSSGNSPADPEPQVAMETE
jgi:hypothetical protein